MSGSIRDAPATTAVRTAEDIGQVLRSHRRRKRLTLERVSGLANVSMRFLSEVERGKPTAEIGKVLKVLRTLGLDVDIRSREPAASAADRETDRGRD